jgi:hypothetical protein
MAPTLVDVSIGVLIGAALLGAAFDRRSILLVAGAAAFPDLDILLSLAVEGGTNAVCHSVWLPLIGVGLLYWETERRERSWLRREYGWWGLRVAWVGLAVLTVAGIGVDLFGEHGVNLFYPVHDQFYTIDDGRLSYSTKGGFVQSYVGIRGDHLIAPDGLGSTADHHVPTWVSPGEDGDRTIYLVREAWQAVVVTAAGAVLAIRLRRES